MFEIDPPDEPCPDCGSTKHRSCKPIATTVVNLTTGAKYDVYIGRPSQFGNPYKIGRDGTRDEVIAKFEQYAAERVMVDAKFASAVRGLHGKALGCYCVPLRCHGDILVEITEHLKADR